MSAPDRVQQILSASGGMQRKPNPPSIPAHDQSYGYEESPEGMLIMQPPPEDGYSGVSGRRSVGPGEYDYDRANKFTKPAVKGSTFGNSRVQREVFNGSTKTPGPGTYAADIQSSRPAANAAFASRVPLAHQKELDSEKINPGPGAYLEASMIKPKMTSAAPSHFGSSQARLASDALTPNERHILSQPGPGYYESQTDFTAKKDTVIAPSGFNTSAQRFKPMQKVREPGPGAYDELDQQSFVVAVQKRTHGRNGAFGSTTRRFHSLPKDPVPDAGQYHPQLPSSPQKDEHAGSAFTSVVERFPKRAAQSSAKAKSDPPVPAPWQYAVKSQNSWDVVKGASRKQDLTFGSTTERFSAKEVNGVMLKAVPGPGAYNSAHDKLRIGSSAENFGSKEARFGTKDRGIFKAAAAATPGPGSYEAAIDAADPLVKRSFNITIG